MKFLAASLEEDSTYDFPYRIALLLDRLIGEEIFGDGELHDFFSLTDMRDPHIIFPTQELYHGIIVHSSRNVHCSGLMRQLSHPTGLQISAGEFVTLITYALMCQARNPKISVFPTRLVSMSGLEARVLTTVFTSDYLASLYETDKPPRNPELTIYISPYHNMLKNGLAPVIDALLAVPTIEINIPRTLFSSKTLPQN
ncbi:MAG: hypothetical protein M1829_005845 [Trizodia sp. TS-e1964]|nr:MAG: hypothetical protein M1829_005845 [Trizodia sp. TS-e1964]